MYWHPGSSLKPGDTNSKERGAARVLPGNDCQYPTLETTFGENYARSRMINPMIDTP